MSTTHRGKMSGVSMPLNSPQYSLPRYPTARTLRLVSTRAVVGGKADDELLPVRGSAASSVAPGGCPCAHLSSAKSGKAEKTLGVGVLRRLVPPDRCAAWCLSDRPRSLSPRSPRSFLSRSLSPLSLPWAVTPPGGNRVQPSNRALRVRTPRFTGVESPSLPARPPGSGTNVSTSSDSALKHWLASRCTERLPNERSQLNQFGTDTGLSTSSSARLITSSVLRGALLLLLLLLPVGTSMS
mmetsp:Transcript_32307/g.86539  ORF Transcript_32307/g.86539 Transcript_32307/m.86539 type:complete len:240 (+) Transcript_32307:973-1692(+)